MNSLRYVMLIYPAWISFILNKKVTFHQKEDFFIFFLHKALK